MVDVTSSNSQLEKRRSNEAGATMLEYVLLISLIALVALTGVARLGSATKGSFVTIRDQLAHSEIPDDPVGGF